MRKLLLSFALILCVDMCWADDFSNLASWIAAQQINAGTSLNLKAERQEVIYWVPVSLGQAGIASGKTDALPYLDLGLGGRFKLRESPNPSVIVLAHFSNIGSTIINKLSGKAGFRIRVSSPPPVIIGPSLDVPLPHQPWTWKTSARLVASFKFGGK